LTLFDTGIKQDVVTKIMPNYVHVFESQLMILQ